MPTYAIRPTNGLPETVEHMDENGRPHYFKVTPRELTPKRAKVADWIQSSLQKAFLACGAFAAWHARPFTEDQVVMALFQAFMAYVAYRILSAWTRDQLKKTTVIVLDEKTVKLRGWFRGYEFDRNLVDRFFLTPHPAAKAEARNHQLEDRRDQNARSFSQRRVYYQDSYLVTLAYDGQSITLAEVFGMPEASRIVARLQYCHRHLNNTFGHGRSGSSQDPAHDWDELPGGLLW